MHQQLDDHVQPRLPPHARLGLLAVSACLGLAACGALLSALGGPASLAWAAAAGITRSYPGGPGCAATLQACINGSSAGDTIVVQPGTYVTNALTLNKAVSLTGVSSTSVTLQAMANQRVLSVTGAAVNSSVVISGLTFAGGHAVGGACPDGCGGAILVTGTAQPRLVNLTLRSNMADAFGGGLYAETGSPLALSGVAFLSNTSGLEGGGAYVGEDAHLSAGVFQNNQCTAPSCGGGGLFVGGNMALAGTHFLSNTSLASGGGALANFSASVDAGVFQNNHCATDGCAGGGLLAGGSLALTSTQFISNRSGSAGGGAFVAGDAALSVGLFQSNQCAYLDCVGGGLSVLGTLTLRGAQFLGNTSVRAGGGAYASFNAAVEGGLFQNNRCTDVACSGGGLDVESGLSMTGAQFLSNTSTSEGGGVFVYISSFVTNTIFIGNQSLDGGGLYQCEGGGTGEYVNDLFAANRATGHGAALFLGSPVGARVLFTTIASPSVGAGAAIYVPIGAVGITDTLIASYTIGIQNDGGSVTKGYNLFSGLGTPFSGTVIGAGSSFTAGAGFRNPALADYHLLAGSSAIDAGADAGIGFDIDGHLRPFGGGFDIGYDEYAIWKLFLPLIGK